MIGPIVIDDVNINTDACEEPSRRMLAMGFDGRIHCVYRNWPAWKANSHISYAYSDDYGHTWTKEDPIVGNPASDIYNPCIVVDSNNIPHIIYQDGGAPNPGAIKCTHRTSGVWSPPQIISRGFAGRITIGPGFIEGEIVQGETSGAEATLNYFISTGGIPPQGSIGVDSPYAGFQLNEWIRGLDSGKRLKYEKDNDGGFSPPSLVIGSDDMLHLVTCKFYLQKPAGGNWSHGSNHDIFPSPCQDSIGIDSNGVIHIIGNRMSQYKYIQGNFNSWTAPIVICTGTTPTENFSMAVDLNDQVHFAVQQTDLGGAHPGILNIHYYKRSSAGVWGTVEHVTDDAPSSRKDPSIAVDRDGNIRVVFRGKGYGVNADDEDLVMRTKPIGGVWGAVQELTDRVPPQYVPNMLHALFPKQSKWWGTYRPNCPDGWASIFNGQQSLDVEYLSEITLPLPPTPTELGKPSDLLCEQKTNPIDVTDPKPEFSAIHRIE